MNDKTAKLTPQSILIVEDEDDLADLLRHNLQREGFHCRCASNGHTAIDLIRTHRPDLILLDRMLPGLSGDEILSQIKRDPKLAATPVIMLTAKVEESDQLVGFAMGAEDYITKPFSMKVLLARVRAILRRAQPPEDDLEVMQEGPIRLSPAHHEVTIDKKPVSLTATEFNLLAALMKGQGRVLDRTRLIDTVLGKDALVTDRTIDVHITALRKKLGDAASWIQTIRGVGYTFRQPAKEGPIQS